MPFRYCPESAFLDYTPTVEVGSAEADYPVTNLEGPYRPDQVFRASDGAVTVRASLAASSRVAAVALLDPSWITETGLTLGGDALTIGLNEIDQRTVGLWENDPPSDLTMVDLVVPAGVMTRGDYSQASTLIVCGEWNELGLNPSDPIRRRRIRQEPTHYLTLEEDWTIEIDSRHAAEVERWLKINREWDQLYLWEEDGPEGHPALMLGQLTEPPQIDLARGMGGITTVTCIWQTVPAPFNPWPRV